jgi:predicted PurR-regulated permease PerM
MKPIATVARNAAVVYLVILGVSAALYFLYLVNGIVLDLFISLFLAVALLPLVQVMVRRRLKRIWASLLAIVAVIVVFGGIAGLIATPLVSQGVNLVENAPAIINQISQNPKLRALDNKYHFLNNLKQTGESTALKAIGIGVPGISIVGKVAGGVTSIVVILLITFFILVDGPDAWVRILKLFNPEQRERYDKLGEKMTRAISGFVTGNLLISVIAGVFALIIFLLLKIPYPFALAALVALLDLIPLVGTAIATVAVAIVAFTKGVAIGLLVIMLLLAYQFVEAHFIQPWVYSRTISLSALLIILASLVGAELGGVVGIILAIPVAAVLQILAIEFITLDF